MSSGWPTLFKGLTDKSIILWIRAPECILPLSLWILICQLRICLSMNPSYKSWFLNTFCFLLIRRQPTATDLPRHFIQPRRGARETYEPVKVNVLQSLPKLSFLVFPTFPLKDLPHPSPTREGYCSRGAVLIRQPHSKDSRGCIWPACLFCLWCSLVRKRLPRN